MLSPSTRYGSVPRLDVRGVSVRFGGNMALDDASLSADEGRVTGLIGPNGAGKTTLFNVVTGLLPPTSGTVAIDGVDITRLNPYKRARRGLARTFQRLELFGSLSARENILVGIEAGRGRPDHGGVRRRQAEEILERVGLQTVAERQANTLSTGKARLVELGRALATRPKLLLLDEPSSGLDQSETDTLGKLLTALAGEGMAVLLVEHDVELVMRVCDQVYVLDFGQIITAGNPVEVQADPRVQLAYLGADVGTEPPAPDSGAGLGG